MGDCKTFTLDLESSEEEAFEDATDELESPLTPEAPLTPGLLPLAGEVPSLDESIETSKACLRLFMENRFEEAKSIVQPYMDYSMSHSISYAAIMALQAMMTVDRKDILLALAAAKKAHHVVKRSRKKNSVFLWKNKSEYSNEELHAELIYAESLLLFAILTFIEDENLVSFIKAAMKIRQCYLAYRECYKILDHYQWEIGTHKDDFESGVRVGYGLFNLLISHLPPRIMHLLEFVGFSGNREVGLRELDLGNKISNGLRTPLCWLATLSFNLVVAYAANLTYSNLPQSEEILNEALAKYPASVIFLFFRGKFEQVSGRFLNAIDCFDRAVNSQSEWQQFHHLCYWEEMATQAILGDWLLAMKLAETLSQCSRWSKALYLYLKASFMLQLITQYERHPTDEEDSDTITAMKLHVSKLMENVPKLRQRIAGKSIPIEKFAAAKAITFQKKGSICLPGIELMYVLNFSKILASDPVSCERMLNVIDEELAAKNLNPKSNGPDDRFRLIVDSKLPSDEVALAVFLRGNLLRELGNYKESKKWNRACLTNWTESSLSADTTYVLPGSWVELASIAIVEKDLKSAKSYLENAQSYKQYHHVSKMQFRIHALQQEISTMENATKGSQKGALQSVSNATSPSKSNTAPNSLVTTVVK